MSRMFCYRMVVSLGDTLNKFLRKTQKNLMKYFNHTLKLLSWLGIALILCVDNSNAQKQRNAIKLKAYTNIDKDYSKETSGIVESKKYPGVFWILDDSGNEDRIYAIDIEGEAASGKKKYKGQKIKGAKNKDWEDILTDDDGHIIIADIGNNCECREDLKFYYVKETSPEVEKNEVVKEIRFKYPEIQNFTRFFVSANYDAEAAFFIDGKIHVLTKHSKMSGRMRLFRLDDPKEDVVNILTLVGEYAIDGAVTSADVNADESKIAVLTYNSVWVYEVGDKKNLFGGKAYRRSVKGTQIESIAFHGKELIIADEKEGRMYRIDLTELDRIN